MLKLKYVVVFVALITQPINFAEVANAQLTGSYSSPQGYRTYYSVPGASYWHPVYTPRDNNQISREASDQNSLRAQKKGECADKLRKKYGYTRAAISYSNFPQYLDDLTNQCIKPFR